MTYDEWLKSQGYSLSSRLSEGERISSWYDADGERIDPYSNTTLKSKFYAAGNNDGLSSSGVPLYSLSNNRAGQGDAYDAYADEDFISQQLGNLGYQQAGNFTNPDTMNWFNQKYGTNFGNQFDYWKYLYGGGEQIQDDAYGTLFKTPGGSPTSQYANNPLSYDPPETGLMKWMPYIIAGLGTAGIASGLGAGAGATSGSLGAAEAAAAGTEGFLGLGGAGGSGLAGGVAGYGSGTLGGGMGFFDDVLGGLASDEGFLPGSFDLGESLYGGTAAEGLDMAAAESWLRNLVGGGVSGIGNSLTSGLKSLFGGGNTGGSGGLLDFLGGGLGSAINTAPILAAINYARNQSPFDTSRLESLYSNFNPESQAFQYDTNTGLGREELTSGLSRRGISGSSFGDQSLTNYNTFRDLGRSSLINQGIGTQAGIAGQILNSDVASRQMKNDLYGRALLALSGGLAPRTSGALFA